MAAIRGGVRVWKGGVVQSQKKPFCGENKRQNTPGARLAWSKACSLFKKREMFEVNGRGRSRRTIRGAMEKGGKHIGPERGEKRKSPRVDENSSKREIHRPNRHKEVSGLFRWGSGDLAHPKDWYLRGLSSKPPCNPSTVTRGEKKKEVNPTDARNFCFCLSR